MGTLRGLGLTGTKTGCGIGSCGVCTVLLDGAPVRGCLTPSSAAVDGEVLTIEGLAGSDGRPRLHPVQQAFVDAGAPQCGWCMSGQIVTAVALLTADPDPTEAQIETTMNDVLCRCGAYQRVKAAVRAAAAAQTWSRDVEP